MTLNRTFQALSDPTRRQILDLLKKNEMPAGEIGSHFSISSPSLSHHLNVLKQADLVSTRRQGQLIIYSLNVSVFEELTQALLDYFRPAQTKKRK